MKIRSYQSRLLAVLCWAALALAASARPARAQEIERNAFTWAGKIPEGRWIIVRDVNGAVDVTPTAGDKVEVTATKQVRRGDPDYVRFEVRRLGPGDQDVLVCAIWGENASCDEDGYRSRGDRRGRNNDIRVDFTVKVPRGVKVGAHSVNGAVRVDDVDSEVEAGTVNGSVTVSTVSGPVNASTVNGSVRASMGRFTPVSDMRFSTVNGSVVAEFTGDIDADVDLRTVNGRFITDFPVTIQGRIDPRRLRATLGKGGPRIRLSTVNGSVELRKR